MLRTLNSSQTNEPTTLTPEDIRKLSQRCYDIADRLYNALEQVDRRGVKDEERKHYFDLKSLENDIRSLRSRFTREAMFLTLKVADFDEYRQEIEGATQRLNDAIAQLKQSNIMLGKLASGINFVVGILDFLAGGGVVSIAGTIAELDTLLG